ncbi:MAG: hypothetical protein Q9218_007726, partial [Villophora microphyllina]
DSRNGLKRTDTDYGPAAGGSQPDTSSMKVEEKIARGYHHDLSWRKVLVRLEPDAHNNICVRRMFANAYGWPVVKHLVDTHFADTHAATTADAHESNKERAKPMDEDVGEHGEEVNQEPRKAHHRTESEAREAKDEVAEMRSVANSSMSSQTLRRTLSRQDSAQWDDAMFDVTDDDDEIAASDDAQRQQPTRLVVPNRNGSDKHKEAAAELKEVPQILHGYSTNVGLGKSMEEQMNTLAKAASREGEEGEVEDKGVSEAVASASIGKEKEHS